MIYDADACIGSKWPLVDLLFLVQLHNFDDSVNCHSTGNHSMVVLIFVRASATRRSSNVNNNSSYNRTLAMLESIMVAPPAASLNGSKSSDGNASIMSSAPHINCGNSPPSGAASR